MSAEAENSRLTPALESEGEVGDVLRINKEIDRREVVYRLGGIDPGEGVDVYKIVPLLTKFRDLVTETARQMGCEDEISIKVRPFREGSFITEFVVQGHRSFTELFSSDEASALANALAFLGFIGFGGVSIPKIVKAVSGKVGDFRRNDDGTYTYGHGEESVTVTETEHNALQSPKIADLYGGVAVGPIAEFNGVVEQVNIYVRDPRAEDDGMSEGSTFTKANAKHFAEYSRSADLLDKLESDEDSTIVHGLILVPIAGRYDGGEHGYTFTDGEGGITYKSVTIEDEGFRARLESTEVRFAKGDALRVDMRITQTRTRSGRITTRYAITHVIDYIQYRVPEQGSINFDE